MTLADNPMTALLQMRDVRSSDDSVLRMRLVIGSLLALAGMAWCFSLADEWSRALQLAFWMVAIGMMMTITLIVPLHWAGRDASIFPSLREGRCLQEVLNTPCTAWELTDGVARHSAARGVRFGLPYIPVLYLLSLAACPEALGSLTVVALLWAPATYMMTLGTSYLIQQLMVWSVEGQPTFLARVAEPATALLIMLPAGVFVAISVIGLVVGSLAVAGVFFLGYFLLMVGLSRAMVVAGLEKLPRLEERSTNFGRRFFSPRANRLVTPWSENPIVVRECAREAHRIPFGWLGWLLWKRPVALFGGVVLCTVPTALAAQPALLEGFFWILAITTILVQWTRAVMRTQAAYVSEVEHSTVDMLTQTPISSREYLDGWISVGSHQLLLENLAIVPVLAVVGWIGQVPWWAMLLASLVLVYIPVSGALLGVWASLAPSRSLAHGRFVSLLAGVTVAGGLLWLLAGLVLGGKISLALVQPLGVTQFFLTLVGVAVYCRRNALATLNA